MNEAISIRVHPAVRTELTDRQWAAVRAIAGGYRYVDRRDGIQLVTMKLAYFDGVAGFMPTAAALDLVEPFYADMGRDL